ncbi:hypothetical protein F4820DRAFT_155461 [Hypoxylon rubiginosum]|uniref:Uncharacterized protein n=1 Tax=Hypoxylon rubiginosum TaxID=110542 RepID=A0ACB9YJR8_9PEZI|nr:hypothetical protein F4820DRAFT_155461 [Hypoxylon rubiginosum]
MLSLPECYVHRRPKDFKIRSTGLRSYLHQIGRKSIIKTRYSIVDRLPGLPKLQALSRNGCDLCGLIRDGILSDNADRAMKSYNRRISHLSTGEISISMNYIWNHISGSRFKILLTCIAGSILLGKPARVRISLSLNFLFFNSFFFLSLPLVQDTLVFIAS